MNSLQRALSNVGKVAELMRVFKSTINRVCQQMINIHQFACDESATKEIFHVDCMYCGPSFHVYYSRDPIIIEYEQSVFSSFSFKSIAFASTGESAARACH